MKEFVTLVTAAIVLLLATFAPAQDTQFLFDANGNLAVQMGEINFPPQIIGQPQNRIVAPSESASFSVVAADTRLLSYQWRFNGTNISGATNDAVVRQNVSTNNEGEYRVVLTNPSGSVTSAPALLMIDSDADGVPDSWEQTYFAGLTNSATADFDGDGSSNLQEFLDGTNPTNSISVLYHLTVINDGGSVTIQPASPGYTNGQTVMLTANALSNETFHAWLGDIVTRSNPVTLVMTNNKTVFARFTPIVFQWVNSGGGDWETAANWNPNLVPGLDDIVLIRSGATVTLNTSADCREVTLGGDGAPTLTGSGTLSVRENLFWNDGTMSGSGRTIVETNANLYVSGFPSLTSRTLENGGTVVWSGNGIITLNSGAVITNRAGALFNAQNAVALQSPGGANRFDNAGTFRKSPSTGIMTVGINFNNSGTVEIQSGTLVISGGFTNNGAVNLSPGTTNRLAGGGVSGGTFTAAATALVEWTGGTFTLNPGAQLNGAGFYRLNGGNVTATTDLTVGNLDLVSSSSTLGSPGVITVASGMKWTAGTMGGGGRTIIEPGATLNLDIASSLTFLSTRTLENGGTVLWTGAGNLTLTSGVITNRPGALFHAQNAAQFSFGGGVCRFDNAGTFRKSASAGTTTVQSGMSFNNSGAVEIQSGTLVINGGFTNSGAVNLSPGTTNRLVGGGVSDGPFTAATTAVVEWTGGTFTLNPGAPLNGTGLYRLNGGSVTATADLTVENLDLVSAFSTLGGSGAVTITSGMNWTAGTMSGNSRTIIQPGATVNLAVPTLVALNSRTLENGGTINWTGAGNINVTSSSITNRAGALFHAQNAAQISFGGGVCRLDNAGTFRKSASAGTTTVQSGMTFNNSGTVEIQSGTLTFSGSLTNLGTVNLSPGTTNRLAGGGSSFGLHIAPATAVVEWTGGTFVMNPGAQLSGSGLYRLNGGQITATAALTVENLDLISAFSTLTGTGATTIGNLMNWTAGTMTGNGKTILQPGAMLNLAVPSAVALSGRTLENGGTVLFTGAGSLGISGNAVITNRAGGLFRIENENGGGLGGGIAAGRFDNAGTFRKSAGTGKSAVSTGLSFNNFGTVDIRSGILAANGGFVSSSNGLLNCALGGTTAGTNHGQLQVGGPVTLNGKLSVDLVNGFSPATNDSFTVLTAGTRNGTFAGFNYPSNAVTMQLSNTPNSVIVRVSGLAVPELVLFTPVIASSNVTLCWVADPNKTYRLEFNPDLGPTNWVAVPGEVFTSSNKACISDALTTSNRFYRVRVLP